MNRKSGIIYSYVLMFVEVFSALLFTPFLIRTLGKSEYGVYQLSSQITMYLALLDLGVGNAVVRYIAKYRAQKNDLKQKEFLGIATIFYVVVSIIALAIGIGFVFVFPKIFARGLTADEIVIGQKLLFITVLTCVTTLATSSFAYVLIAYERFSYSKGLSIIFTLLKIIASFTALKLGFSAVGVVLVHFIMNLLTRLLYVAYVLLKIKLKPKFSNPDISFIKEIVTYSSFVFLQMLATQINSMTDSILLGILAKGSSVIIAIYGAGAQIIQYFKTIGTNFSGVLMAGVVRLVESGANSKSLQNEMVRIGRIIFMVLGIFFIVFVAFGKDFVILWVGEDYIKSYYVAVAIMAPTMISLVQSIGSQILWAMNRHKVQAIIQIVSAILNAILTAILIMWKPLEGAVIGSVIALVFGDVICMNVMYKKEIKISILQYFIGLTKGILPALLISAVSGYLFNMFGFAKNNWVGLIINCTVMVVSYGICMLLFGMNKSEKLMILGMFNKFLIKTKLIKGDK